MRRSIVCAILAMSFLLLFISAATSMDAGMTRSMTGKVIGVDDNGKGISISSMVGGKEIVAGAIVTEATTVHVKGRKAGITDINAGDRVTLTYSYEKDDLYAKKIVKK